MLQSSRIGPWLGAIMLVWASAEAAPISNEEQALPAGPKGAAQRTSRVAGSGVPFKDCAEAVACPEMVVVPSSPAGFKIGSPNEENGHLLSEAQTDVAIKAFAIGTAEVSTGQYLACVNAKACRYPEWLEPGGEHNIETGSGVTYKSLAKYIKGDDQPIVGVSWDDAVAYTKWLTETTGHAYRLPSEAEWEYAARAGTSTPYWWGEEPKHGGEVMACCRGCGSEFDGVGFAAVKSFKANPWGLYNVHGNVWEWVADYYCDSYASGPLDGSPRTEKACPKQDSPEGLRVFRGGSCFYEPRQMRSAMRLRNWPSFRNQTIGFRVARDIAPAGAPSRAEGVPVRKPGHWQITTIAEAIGTTTIDTCITESDSIVAPADGRECAPPQVTHAGDQVIVNVACKTKLGEERTSTLYTGDFTTWYRGIVKMTFDPPAGGLANMGVTLDAKFIGPECPATKGGTKSH